MSLVKLDYLGAEIQKYYIGLFGFDREHKVLSKTMISSNKQIESIRRNSIFQEEDIPSDSYFNMFISENEDCGLFGEYSNYISFADFKKYHVIAKLGGNTEYFSHGDLEFKAIELADTEKVFYFVSEKENRLEKFKQNCQSSMLKNVCLKYNFRGTEIMNETSNFMQTCKDFLHSIVFYYSEFIRVNSMLWSYGHMSVSNIVACYFEDDKLNVIYFDENYKRYEIDVKSEKFKSELVEEIRGGEKGIKKVFDMLIHERKYVNYVSKGYLELFERGS